MSRAKNSERDGKGPALPTARRSLVENEIYEHATRLFAERGFAGTTLQDIADALGVTRPALYYYVKSKEEILAKLVHEITEASATDLQEIATQTGLRPSERLRRLARATIIRVATNAPRFRLLVKSESELPDGIAQTNLEGRRAVLATITQVIQDGVVAGEFRPVDARTGALGVLGMCNWVAWWYRTGDDIDMIADTLTEMAVSGISRATHRLPQVQGPAGALALLREDIDHLEHLLTGNP